MLINASHNDYKMLLSHVDRSFRASTVHSIYYALNPRLIFSIKSISEYRQSVS